jgi:hypothetical protein
VWRVVGNVVAVLQQSACSASGLLRFSDDILNLVSAVGAQVFSKEEP